MRADVVAATPIGTRHHASRARLCGSPVRSPSAATRTLTRDAAAQAVMVDAGSARRRSGGPTAGRRGRAVRRPGCRDCAGVPWAARLRGARRRRTAVTRTKLRPPDLDIAAGIGQARRTARDHAGRRHGVDPLESGSSLPWIAVRTAWVACRRHSGRSSRIGPSLSRSRARPGPSQRPAMLHAGSPPSRAAWPSLDASIRSRRPRGPSRTLSSACDHRGGRRGCLRAQHRTSPMARRPARRTARDRVRTSTSTPPAADARGPSDARGPAGDGDVARRPATAGSSDRAATARADVRQPRRAQSAAAHDVAAAGRRR